MVFELVSPILGFEDVNCLELKKIDDCFSSINSNKGYTWTLVNPFLLRPYSFEIPYYAKILLDIHLEDSKVQFIAPIIFNYTNRKAIQLVLSSNDYPEFSKLESLKSFVR